MLGEDILTNDPTLCANMAFWRKQKCGSYNGTDMIRCHAGHSGQCVLPAVWGLQGVEVYWGGGSCQDGSDKYRPIKQLTQEKEHGRQPSPNNNDEKDNFGQEEKPTAADKTDSAEVYGGKHSRPQVWKISPKTEEGFKKVGKEEREKYKKDSLTGLWMIPERNPFKVPSVRDEYFKKGPAWLVGPGKKDWAKFYSSDDYVKDEATNRWMATTTEEACEGFVCKVKLIVIVVLN